MKIIIRGGSVYDGNGGLPKKIDILIRNEKVVGLGNFAKKNAEISIDASQCSVFPGFIDTGTDFDHRFGVFDKEIQNLFLSQGITTVIGGNHGLSLAPFPGKNFFKKFPASNGSAAAIYWHSFGEFSRVLSNVNLRLNFGSLLGYPNLREFSSGAFDRDLTLREREKLISDLKRALSSGGLGVSFNFDLSAENIPKDEIRDICAVSALTRRLISLDLEISGISEEPGKADCLKKLLIIFKDTGARIILTILHGSLKSKERDHKLFKEIIGENSSGADICLQLSPMPRIINSIACLLPEIFQENNPRNKPAVYRKKIFKKEIVADILPNLSKIAGIAGTPQNISSFRGKTLEELSDTLHLSKEDSLLFIMESSRLKATVFCEKCSYCNSEFFSPSPALLTSGNAYSSGSSVFGKEKEIPSFLKIVREEFHGSLEQAIPKLTSLPARKYNITERGGINEGSYADIVVADENLEITTVMVNGSIVLEKSKESKIEKFAPTAFPGKFLKKK